MVKEEQTCCSNAHLKPKARTCNSLISLQLLSFQPNLLERVEILFSLKHTLIKFWLYPLPKQLPSWWPMSIHVTHVTRSSGACLGLIVLDLSEAVDTADCSHFLVAYTSLVSPFWSLLLFLDFSPTPKCHNVSELHPEYLLWHNLLP